MLQGSVLKILGFYDRKY